MNDKHEPSYCLECFNYFWTATCSHPSDEVWAERNRIIKLLTEVAKQNPSFELSGELLIECTLEYLIALIKGENK